VLPLSSPHDQLLLSLSRCIQLRTLFQFLGPLSQMVVHLSSDTFSTSLMWQLEESTSCIMEAVFQLSLASTPVDYCQDTSINSEYRQLTESDWVTLVPSVLRSNVHRSQECLMLQLTSSQVLQQSQSAGKILRRTVVL